MSVESKIREASAKNQELLAILRETDHAVPDLEQHKRFLAEMDKSAAESDKKVASLEKKRQRELKDHEKYRDSVMRRFFYKIGGKEDKFDAKASKEEKEYFEVLQEEHRVRDVNANLHQQVEEARAARAELEQKAARHQEAQRELDSLYHAIFAGPTPSFPEEDARERDSDSALQAYHEARTKVECEQQAARLIEASAEKMRGSILSMEDALGHSRMDMFGGGSMSDMMERNALHRAETQMQQARTLVAQAQRFSPFVEDLPEARINHGDLVTDVFFDNIFTDMHFHEEIKRGREEVMGCAAAAARQLRLARERVDGLQGELGARELRLDETRRALQRAREEAFERVLAERGAGAGEGGAGEQWWNS